MRVRFFFLLSTGSSVLLFLGGRFFLGSENGHNVTGDNVSIEEDVFVEHTEPLYHSASDQ